MSSRILAVDDTPALRALLQLCLTRGGYQADLADDGQAAVEMFLAGSYAAVVMDIQMPAMDGLTAVALMREAEKSRGRTPVPILALTANAEPADLRRCLEAGFTAAIRKPFGREELLAAVTGALGAAPPRAADSRVVVTADPEFADLIPPFLDNCRRDAGAMEEALERGDYAGIAAAGHRLAGAGASFGFQLLSDESRRLEAAAKSADAAGVRTHLGAIRRYLETVSVVYP